MAFNSISLIKRVSLSVGILVSSLAMTVIPASANVSLVSSDTTSAVRPASCYVSGNAPYTSYGQVKGKANRYGCGDTVELTSKIMKSISFLPDHQVGIGRTTLINGSVTGEGPCSRGGHGSYYTKAVTDTGQSSSGSSRTLC